MQTNIDDIIELIGANLRELRYQAKLTQAELADEAICTARTISNIENRKFLKPRARTAKRIAAALERAGVSLQ